MKTSKLRAFALLLALTIIVSAVPIYAAGDSTVTAPASNGQTETETPTVAPVEEIAPVVVEEVVEAEAETAVEEVAELQYEDAVNAQ